MAERMTLICDWCADEEEAAGERTFLPAVYSFHLGTSREHREIILCLYCMSVFSSAVQTARTERQSNQ